MRGRKDAVEYAGMSHIAEQLEIRLFGSEDSVSELTGLVNRAYKQLGDMGLKYVGTWQGDEMTERRITDAECYVGLLDGRLAATILLRSPGKKRGPGWYSRDDVAVFGQFGVEPELRGRGIGSMMLKRVEDRAREMGAAELALDTAEPATHLIEWYTRRGYRFIEYVQWSVTNYRSVIMSKTLRPEDE